MKKLNAKLRIGEKIGFGFGLVGLLFLGVIWQYQSTLQQSHSDYRRLQDVYEAKKSLAFDIEGSVLKARISEKNFSIGRDLAYAQETKRHIARGFDSAEKLGAIDAAASETAAQITGLMKDYERHFLALVDALQEMGLDHNSGLQGAFRNAVHELEKMAGQHKVGRLYLNLLQIRRGEKDLGLRREEQYRLKVLQLIDEFKQGVAASELVEAVKQQLTEEAETYRSTFETYAQTVLANEDIRGGKGPFRQTAHRIEALLKAHYIPDLESSVLQLRRREKDYLLRHDTRYVEMALAEIQRISTQIDLSVIAAAEKSRFRQLLENYRRDFLALVEQNKRIFGLTEEMRQAVSEVTSLAEENVDSANRSMDEVVENINRTSRENAQVMLWIAALATLMGIALSIYLTLQIARPLRRMAGLLDQLAYEEPVEKVPFVPGGRDEVNAMAGSVNTMGEHRNRFIEWWKASIQEADACQKLQQTLAERAHTTKPGSMDKALEELRQAEATKAQLVYQQHQEIEALNHTIVERAEELLEENTAGEKWLALNAIRDSSKAIQSSLKMLLTDQRGH